jgi:hypothetical protein
MTTGVRWVVYHEDGHVVYDGPRKPLPTLHGGGRYNIYVEEWYNQTGSRGSAMTYTPDVTFDHEGKPVGWG